MYRKFQIRIFLFAINALKTVKQDRENGAYIYQISIYTY